jgi:hypothetical protein
VGFLRRGVWDRDVVCVVGYVVCGAQRLVLCGDMVRGGVPVSVRVWRVD